MEPDVGESWFGPCSFLTGPFPERQNPPVDWWEGDQNNATLGRTAVRPTEKENIKCDRYSSLVGTRALEAPRKRPLVPGWPGSLEPGFELVAKLGPTMEHTNIFREGKGVHVLVHR